MSITMYYDEDADQSLLEDKTIAIIGYGSQGHGQAQNLKESGYDVIVSELEGSENYELAQEHGFDPVSAEEAAKEADIIQILVPDEVQKGIYYNSIQDNLEEGDALVFSHGFNVHFDQIVPPENIDVYMVAPKGPGHLVRREYTKGKGVPSLIAVYQNATGKAKDLALAHACGIGAGKAGIIETTFKEETETDLFGEQSVLCGGVTELVKSGFETLVENGYQPEIAFFECLHELKLIVDLFYEGGIENMYNSVSDTAEYGGMTCGPKVITEETKERMQEVLEDVQSGDFAKDWILENKAGRPKLEALRRDHSKLEIEKVGKNIRDMMPWLKEEE